MSDKCRPSLVSSCTLRVNLTRVTAALDDHGRATGWLADLLHNVDRTESALPVVWRPHLMPFTEVTLTIPWPAGVPSSRPWRIFAPIVF